MPGVGEASLFGSADYSMRIWLRPDMVARYNSPRPTSPRDPEQNAQFAAGRFGEEPMHGDQAFTYRHDARPAGRPREFEKSSCARPRWRGAALKDVARVELGSLNYSTISATLNGAPTVPDRRLPAAGANALQVAAAVSGRPWTAIAERFPDGLRYASRSTPRASSRSRFARWS